MNATPNVIPFPPSQSGAHNNYSLGYLDGLRDGEHLTNQRWLWRGLLAGVGFAVAVELIVRVLPA